MLFAEILEIAKEAMKGAFGGGVEAGELEEEQLVVVEGVGEVSGGRQFLLPDAVGGGLETEVEQAGLHEVGAPETPGGGYELVREQGIQSAGRVEVGEQGVAELLELGGIFGGGEEGRI